MSEATSGPTADQVVIWNNPISRLLQLIENSRLIEGNVEGVQGWLRLLNARTYPELFRRMGLMAQLPNVSRDTLTTLYPNLPQKAYQHWFVQTTDMLCNPSLIRTPWTNVRQAVDDNTIAMLHTAELLISTKQTYAAENIPDLADLLIQIEAIKKDISANGEISPSIKGRVLGLLDAFVTSIDEFFLTGSGSLHTLVDAAAGTLRDVEIREFSETDSGKRFFNIVAVCANVCTVAQTAAPAILAVAGTIWTALGHGK